MSFELIAAEGPHYPKALMCRALGLSRSAHHAFRARRHCPREMAPQKSDELMAPLFAEPEGRYGAPQSRRSCDAAGTAPVASTRPRPWSDRASLPDETPLTQGHPVDPTRADRTEPPAAVHGVGPGLASGSPTRPTYRSRPVYLPRTLANGDRRLRELTHQRRGRPRRIFPP